MKLFLATKKVIVPKIEIEFIITIQEGKLFG